MFLEETAPALCSVFLLRSDGAATICPRYEPIFLLFSDFFFSKGSSFQNILPYTSVCTDTHPLRRKAKIHRLCVTCHCDIQTCTEVRSCEILSALAARLQLTFCFLSSALQLFFFLLLLFFINITTYSCALCVLTLYLCSVFKGMTN